MYYFSQPPFLIPLFGLFIGVTCGFAFQTLIQQRAEEWKKNVEAQDAYKLRGADIYTTYWGICLGIWIFLGGGLLLFGFTLLFAYGLTLPLTIATGALIWKQLNEAVQLLQKGGSKALDLDFFT